jgi:hypothetical protein
LIGYLQFMSGSRIFHSYRNVTIAGKGLQNIGLCSVFRAVEQGRGLYLARIAVTRIFCFLQRTIPYSCILIYARRCRITILIWIIMGPHAITDNLVLQGYLLCCLMSMLYGHYSDLVLLLLWYVLVLIWIRIHSETVNLLNKYSIVFNEYCTTL